ncbi:flagellar motor switch protein FliG [Sulfitobacter mediterraneus]|uniref:flagellar motor switch protein FliG n=1 Tax=Sulfitobacter mediterraneus TaxID=83219 RepID=UPI001931A030|nr:FliG C-terminal domain-containing protein [Sulfitobacter mediterraneus]MBM1311832.1 flagellar motor switch protein FliG [Sulfitobacter mediterraneus]MBM1315713.1 flagellar motor switch protein FliG [Sulfitobacter mediterraneus]MBM1324075.1 flagellar motor switch protein FliG [Sulfitobacter mediterraneus]MBM1327987.1 flagellar motor switch protein FliG [Sulfitobacter mediterraneus]MBM1399335.1 flagellar motor switch protein FliG [Sulfitobacter mediterraneus]
MNDIVPMNSLAPLPVLDGGGVSVSLSRRAKAAIIVRLLLNDGADIPLEDLPDELQANLTHQMGKMRVVDRDTLMAVVEEFAGEVEKVGLSFPAGIAEALDALDGKISPHTAARLRKEAGVRQFGNPWARLGELGADRLLPAVENESIEVAAVMLSKLPVAMSAEILGKLPGPQARRITYAVSLTGAVTPEAVDRIGLSLASQLDAQPATAFDSDPVERVGAILNSSTNVTRDDVLTGLDETDQGFANAVRKAIFTFANIPARIAPRDIPRILREVDPDKLVLALAGAEAAGFAASRDFVLENMSGRMADQLREEIGEAGKVKAADVEAAMADIVEVIRAMEQSGDLLLVVEEEDED